MDFRCRHLTIFFVLLALLTACAAPMAAPQATTHVYRIGYFSLGGDPRPGPNVRAFVDELSRLSYVVDQNLTIEYRWAEGKSERLPELARELIALKLDAVFTSTDRPAQALLEADADVPIVMVT